MNIKKCETITLKEAYYLAKLGNIVNLAGKGYDLSFHKGDVISYLTYILKNEDGKWITFETDERSAIFNYNEFSNIRDAVKEVLICLGVIKNKRIDKKLVKKAKNDAKKFNEEYLTEFAAFWDYGIQVKERNKGR